MLNRRTFLDTNPQFVEGLAVYSKDGEHLGKIVSMDELSFTIEKGFFFPKEFSARYEDVQSIRDGSVQLNESKETLSNWRDPSYAGWSQIEDVNEGRLEAQPLDQYKSRYQDSYERVNSQDQIRVPVMEEELEANKTVRQAGEVKVKKIVHTEFKHFTIPVMKEEIRVERAPVQAETSSEFPSPNQAFNEETIKVPLMEEEVTISKRPVIKEEIRLTKERLIKEQEVSGEVRKEDVRIEQPDRNRIKKAG